MKDEKREHIDNLQTLAVWDLPTRLFHWSIVILIGFAWWSAEQRLLDWHRRTGYALLTLLIFRLLWGFFGSGTARFANFVKSPARATDYLRNDLFARGKSASVGHNPLGGWSAVMLLLVMLLQVVLGLFAVDIDGIESGPLSYLVSFDIGRNAATAHHVIFNVLTALIAVHIAAIAFYYFYKKQNLTKAMFTGKIPGNGADHPKLSSASPLLATLLFAFSAGSVILVTNFLGR